MRILEAVQNHMLTQMLDLCKHELELTEIPEIVFIEVDPTTGSGTSFGEFNNNKIEVVSMGRHPMDVMRTLAHELVHWKQMVSNMPLDGGDGSDTENQANAVAGIIMRKFGKMHPEYFMDSIS